MSTPISDPLVGRTIAQYHVVARVGGGAMGVVYKARDEKLGRTVALKFLPQQWSHDDTAKQRFVREAQAASATNHPSICTIHDIETADDGQLFIVMAFYEGQTLKERLTSGPLAVEEALDIASQIADGLARAHAQGVVHRDIKPGNVILTEDGVRVLDFGLATFVDALKITTENATIGTPAYMSPEQVRGQESDARTDVWAVGVVLYEMLTGRAPFQGTHFEAVAHAIRTEPPPPLRSTRPEIPEEVEQLVFRAMHKEPGVRYRDGRELARALRQVRGLSVPLELYTQPVPRPAVVEHARPVRSWRRATAAVVVLALAGAAAYVWFMPIERTTVLIVPFGNQTGDSSLDEYKLGLTHTLTQALRSSPHVAPAAYGRLLQPLTRFVREGTDVSSREAIAAVASDTGVPLVLMPTLLRDGGEWRARVELRNAENATSLWRHETAPRTTALSKDAAYVLTMELAAAIDMRFASRRALLVQFVKGLVGVDAAPVTAHVQSLDAAKAFEEGVRLYEDLEYSAARDAFAAAVGEDRRSPVALAWLSRVMQLTRDDRSLDSAEEALSFIKPGIPRTDALFVEAVAAEARRDFTAAEERYRELAAALPGDSSGLAELGGFLDRRDRLADAAQVYRDVLAMDSRFVRPHLELCRMYSRLNETVEARKHGEAALTGYRALAAGRDGARPSAGEAQSLMCLADVFRAGSSADRNEARRYAETSRDMFERLGRPYNTARADYYVALMAGTQGQYNEAVTLGERALATAIKGGNLSVQPLILVNLGVAHVLLGNREIAAGYYQQASKLHQSWREEARAAQIQANRGAMLIEYGDPEQGLRDVQNARAVTEKLDDSAFQAFCARVIATYYRNHGRHVEAQTELNKGMAIASERNLTESVTVMRTHLAMSQFETGDYAGARASLLQTLKDGTGRLSTEARIRLARTHLRLGALGAADEALSLALGELDKSPNNALRSLVLLVQGERALELSRLDEARRLFGQASGLWVERLPEASTVEARAYLGLLTAQRGRGAEGRELLRSSLAAAEKLSYVSLEARSRLLLAQLEFQLGRFEEAAVQLRAIPGDSDMQTIGVELRAEVHHWASRIRESQGDSAGAHLERVYARARVEAISQRLPQTDRDSFQQRPSIRRYVS